MRYYDARQRKDGYWDWTYLWGNNIYPGQSCAGVKCEHKTKEEAYAHESERINNLIKNVIVASRPADSLHRCYVEGCKSLAELSLYHPDISFIYSCQFHAENPDYKAKPYMASI